MVFIRVTAGSACDLIKRSIANARQNNISEAEDCGLVP